VGSAATQAVQNTGSMLGNTASGKPPNLGDVVSGVLPGN
jgi:hypothetical protein